MIIKYFKDYIENISEGLIKTYNHEIVLNDIVRSLRLMDIEVNGRSTADKIELELININNININKLEIIFDHIMVYVVNRGGWFPSTMEITNTSDQFTLKKYNFDNIIRNHGFYKNIKITFECKFDEKENNIPEKLYHISIKEYDVKIIKYGLSPKSQSKLSSHIDRVYLCKTIQDCENLIPQMKLYFSNEKDDNFYRKNKKEYRKNTDFIIYEVDNSENQIKDLYKDPNYRNGYYTLSNISNKCIRKIKEIEND